MQEENAYRGLWSSYSNHSPSARVSLIHATFNLAYSEAILYNHCQTPNLATDSSVLQVFQANDLAHS